MKIGFLRYALRIFFFLILLAGTVSAQIPNKTGDDICNPIDLPALGQPQPCALGGDAGTYSFTGTTHLLNFSNPPVGGYLPCLVGYGPDGFFRFTATTNTIVFSFAASSASFLTPLVSLYEKTGNVCDQVTPRGCWSGGTAFSDTFKALTIGKEYVIGVAGTSSIDTGAFTMSLHSFTNCNSCLQNATLTTYPPPVDGYYPPGTTVTFVYSITDIEQISGIGLHGLTMKFGPGWVPSSVAPLTPASPADSMGQWNWYSNLTTSVGNLTGFFYESTLPQGNSSTNPLDNYGDHRPFSNVWTFSWKATTDTGCTNSADLTYEIMHYMDNVTGVSTIQGCTGDVPYEGMPALNCCQAAQVTTTAVTCATAAIGGFNTDGTITISVPGIYAYTFLIRDEAGDTLYINQSQFGSHTEGNLAPGYYSVYVYDPVLSCFSLFAAHISTPMILNTIQSGYSCAVDCNGAASVNVNTIGGYSIQWYDGNLVPLQTYQQPNSAQAVYLCDGWHYVTVTGQNNGCRITDSVEVHLFQGPSTVFHYTTASPDTLCPGTYTVQVPPAIQGGEYILETIIPGFSVDSATGTLVVAALPHDTTISVKYHVAFNPCPGYWFEDIYILAAAGGVTVSSGQLSGCEGAVLSGSFTATADNGTDPLNWYASSGQQNLLQANTTTFNPFSGPVSQGNYTFYVSPGVTSNCPLDEDTVYATVYALPGVNAGADIDLCPGEDAQLTVQNASSAIWTPSTGLDNQFSLSPVASPSQTTTYSVLGYDAVTGCANIDSVTVTVGASSCELFAWGGFTPNGDGKNEEWIIEGIDAYPLNRVTIFSRWGATVWSTFNYDNTTNVWRGEAKTGGQLPPGTYFYVIQTSAFVKKGWVEVSK